MISTLIRKLLRFAIRHSTVLFILVACISIFFGYYATKVKINPDVERLIPDNDNIKKYMEMYADSDGNDHLVISVTSDNLYDLENLQLLDNVINKLEDLRGSSRSINPFNMITFRKDGRRLEVLTMSPGGKAPATQEELAVFKERLLNDPFAENLVVSEDGEVFSILIPIMHSTGESDYLKLVRQYLKTLKGPFKTYMTAGALFSEAVQEYLIRDLTILLVLAVAVILFIYYMGFRAFRSALLTLSVVAMGTLWSVGFMALAGFTITIVSITIPTLVLTLGTSYSIHILNQYFRESLEHMPKEWEDKKSAKLWVADSVQHVGKTVLMACLTTVIGFLSLLATSMNATREFGIATTVGIISCAVLSFFFLPAMLTHLRPPTKAQQKKVREGTIARAMGNLSAFVLKRRVFILIFFILVLAGFGVVSGKLKYETNIINYFPKREEIVRDTNYIFRKMKGYDEFTVTLTAPEGEENYFLKEDVLKQISEFEDRLMEDPDITGIYSFVAYLEHLNKIMYGEKKVPDSRPLTFLMSRYIRTLANDPEFKNMIGTMANEDFTRFDITVWCYDHTTQTMSRDTSLARMLGYVNRQVDSVLDPEMNPAVWGILLQMVTVSDSIGRDQLVSTVLSLLFVFILTTITFRSFRYGFYSLVPLITGILLNFIFMVIFKIPMDMTTVMFSIVVIGVGVDNSIHFILRFREQARIYGDDIKTILSQALKIAGRPIIITTSSIIGGLLVLTFASFRPITYFGILVSFALLTAAVSTLVILPAILTFGWKIQKRMQV